MLFVAKQLHPSFMACSDSKLCISEEIPEVILDEHMDLLRALEMSRLQYLRDAGLLHEPDGQK